MNRYSTSLDVGESLEEEPARPMNPPTNEKQTTLGAESAAVAEHQHTVEKPSTDESSPAQVSTDQSSEESNDTFEGEEILSEDEEDVQDIIDEASRPSRREEAPSRTWLVALVVFVVLIGFAGWKYWSVPVQSPVSQPVSAVIANMTDSAPSTDVLPPVQNSPAQEPGPPDADIALGELAERLKG